MIAMSFWCLRLPCNVRVYVKALTRLPCAPPAVGSICHEAMCSRIQDQVSSFPPKAAHLRRVRKCWPFRRPQGWTDQRSRDHPISLSFLLLLDTAAFFSVVIIANALLQEANASTSSLIRFPLTNVAARSESFSATTAAS